MKSLFLLLSLGATTVFASAPVVSQVQLTSRAPGQPVKIRYALSGAPAVITVDLLTNGVSVGDAALANLTGAVNARVTPGSGQLALWTPPADFACAPADLEARVTAWATNCPPDYMVVSLTNRQEAVRYYTSTNAFPVPLEDRRYRTTHLVMRKIPAAGVVWTMGSRTYEPDRQTEFEYLRPVMLTADYYLAIYETTRRQYQYASGSETLPSIGSYLPAGLDSEDDIPVGHLAYANLRSYVTDTEKIWPAAGSTLPGGSLVDMRNKTGIELDLPTEAQWEYACRAGTSAQTYLDVDLIESTNRLDEIAWYQGNASNDTYKCLVPHRVGLKKPNAWGLYDMLGNMNEWVLNWATVRPGTYGTLEIDPVGSDSPYVSGENLYRFMRSGSFAMYATCLRAGFSFKWGQTWNDSSASTTVCGPDANNQKMAKYAGGFRLAAPAQAVR